MSARTWCLGVLLVALVHVAIMGTAEAEQLKVAVVASEAINLDESTVDALSQDLAEALNTELDVEAIGGLEVRRLLPDTGLPDECAVTPSCTAEVARTLGVAEVLFVVMVKNGASGSVQIDTTWVSPSTGKRATRPGIVLTSVEGARTRFSSNAIKLMPDAPVRPMAVGSPVLQVERGRPRHITIPAIVAAGVTVAALGTGVVVGLDVRSRYRDCEQEPYCKDGEKKSIRARGFVADAAFVVALAGAVTTAVLYGTSAEEPSVLVGPTKDGAMVTGMLRF